MRRPTGSNAASQPRQIGQAILLYANENKRAYRGRTQRRATSGTRSSHLGTAVQRTGHNRSPTLPDVVNRPTDNDVTAALFLLPSTEEILPNCSSPLQQRRKWDFGGSVATRSQLVTIGTDHRYLNTYLSYSYQCPSATPTPSASGFKINTSIQAEFAVAADINPGNAPSL